MRYRLYVQGAYEAGKAEPPQKVILELAVFRYVERVRR